MKRRDDGSGWLGVCIWCCQPVQASQGHYSQGISYHRGECAEAFGARRREWLEALRQERQEASRPVQGAFALDLAG